MAGTYKKIAPYLFYSEEDGAYRLDNVRLSYPHLFEPWGKKPTDVKKYSATGIIDPKTHKDAIKTLLEDFKALGQAELGIKIGRDMLCLRDGTDSGKEEQEGMWVLRTSETKRPSVRNTDMTPLIEEDNVVYAGCRVHILFRPWVQDNEWGKRVNAGLIGIKFHLDDEAFSSTAPVDVDEAFDDDDAGPAGGFEDGGLEQRLEELEEAPPARRGAPAARQTTASSRQVPRDAPRRAAPAAEPPGRGAPVRGAARAGSTRTEQQTRTGVRGRASNVGEIDDDDIPY